MSLMSIFDISGTGMSAQTIRMNTTASNIANVESVSADPSKTYRARQPVFAAIQQDVFDQANPGMSQGMLGTGLSSGAGVSGCGRLRHLSDRQYRGRNGQHDFGLTHL